VPHEDKNDADLTPEQLQTRQLLRNAMEELDKIVYRQRQQQLRRRRKAKQAKETE
jgi:hypothetical protein